MGPILRSTRSTARVPLELRRLGQTVTMMIELTVENIPVKTAVAQDLTGATRMVAQGCNKIPTNVKAPTGI